MSTLNVDNRERARVREKKNEGDDFVGRKKRNFYSGG